MSTSPRDAGIPMLTEVIEEDVMEFTGPPAPQPALQPTDLLAPPVVSYASVFAVSDYQPAAMAGQYGSAAQFARSYPLPLKPAAAPAPAAPPVQPMPVVVAPEPEPALTTPAASVPPAISEEEWQRMERRVRERILGQLLSRTDAMLEERIRASVASVLEQAVDALAATLRASLHKTLEDVVSRAVAQEISRLQSPKK